MASAAAAGMEFVARMESLIMECERVRLEEQIDAVGTHYLA